MNSAELDAVEEAPLDLAVYRALQANIDSHILLPGMALSDYRLAIELSISREPIARALSRLEREGRIERDDSRGYIVAGAARISGGSFPKLEIPPEFAAVVRGRAEWQRVWDRVLGDLIGSMPFGRYKIVESSMAAHYEVSRTVTRDLLARLETMGIVEREGRSQCFLRQLTSQVLSELYEIRQLLEPRALLTAAPHINPEELRRIRNDLEKAEQKYPDIELDLVSRCEMDLHVNLLSACPNRSLTALVRQSQVLALATNRLLPMYLGFSSVEPFIAEHRMVVDYLLSGSPEAAALALEAHLRSAEKKQQGRLVELRLHQPAALPYLLSAKSR